MFIAKEGYIKRTQQVPMFIAKDGYIKRNPAGSNVYSKIRID